MRRLLAFIILILSFYLPIYGFYVFCKISYPQELTSVSGYLINVEVTNRFLSIVAFLMICLFVYFILVLKCTEKSHLVKCKILKSFMFIIFYTGSCFYMAETYYLSCQNTSVWKEIFLKQLIYKSYFYWLALLGILISLYFHQYLNSRLGKDKSYNDFF